jgi:hypothetical protein
MDVCGLRLPVCDRDELVGSPELIKPSRASKALNVPAPSTMRFILLETLLARSASTPSGVAKPDTISAVRHPAKREDVSYVSAE